MNISLAAIAIAWYIVHDEPMSDKMPYSEASEFLENNGHYTLLTSCNLQEVVLAYPNYEKAIQELPYKALEPYRIRGTNYEGKVCYLKTPSGEYAKYHQMFSGYILEGGTAPHNSASTGKVFTKDNRVFYPTVLGLKWEKAEET